ncbi:hypothetical protein SCAR479_14037 [Seiridium cardinale]|uniref:Uncharacterized protein n=1 Tax=Seiridium cardinale TaxID=138064 RepID=A0ABR2X6P5_9PEZI
MGKFCNSKRTFTTHDPDENISGDAALSPIAEDWSKQGVEEWKASRRSSPGYTSEESASANAASEWNICEAIDRKQEDKALEVVSGDLK